MTSVEALVLMGPPGSGKSHLGRRLSMAGVVDYCELEPELVRRFGVGEAFAARKAEALAFIEASLEAQISQASRPVLIESTGLSDRPMLLRLAERRRLLWAAIVPPKAVCLERVTTRTRDRNLSNDPVMTERFHDHWRNHVATGYRFDLVLDGLDDVVDGERIVAALKAV